MKNSSPTIEQERLAAGCQAFVDLANSLSEERFFQSLAAKWSVAEVMQHLYLSARAVARLMAGPREVLDQWGRADTPLQTYDELAATYQQVLATGAKAPASMSPRLEDMQVDKQVIVDRFATVYQALIDAIGTWPEAELTMYCMPHPVLGKLTVLEMLYFTSTHTQHHLRLLPAIKKDD